MRKLFVNLAVEPSVVSEIQNDSDERFRSAHASLSQRLRKHNAGVTKRFLREAISLDSADDRGSSSDRQPRKDWRLAELFRDCSLALVSSAVAFTGSLACGIATIRSEPWEVGAGCWVHSGLPIGRDAESLSLLSVIKGRHVIKGCHADRRPFSTGLPFLTFCPRLPDILALFHAIS
jgi:hypothetical protein